MDVFVASESYFSTFQEDWIESQVPANPLKMKIIRVVFQIEGNILVWIHMVYDTLVDRVIHSITLSYGNRNNNGTTRGAKRKLECLNSGAVQLLDKCRSTPKEELIVTLCIRLKQAMRLLR